LLKETEAAEDICANSVINDHPEGAANAEVVRIANENLMNSDGLDTAELVLRASTNGTDQARESEV
jgi:hypothetical protein